MKVHSADKRKDGVLKNTQRR